MVNKKTCPGRGHVMRQHRTVKREFKKRNEGIKYVIIAM